MAGSIDQLSGLVELQIKLALTVTPFIEVFVKVTAEFVQTIVFGDIVNSACGLVDVVTGSTVDSEKPQGFSALILMKKEFGLLAPTAPQEVAVNNWV
jgi:hypothetical protein